MKKILTTLIILLFAATAYPQGSNDAYQFSQAYYQGTAKALGMGNALGAVGGDMTSVSINPAGLGIYRSDELAMSLGLNDNFHTSTYYSNTANANKFRVNIPNLGYVSSKQKSNFRPVRFRQFGLTFNRINDYNLHTFAKGFNPSSARANNSTFLNQIEGLHPDDLPNDAWMMWQTYLIDDHQDDDGYYYTTRVPNKVWQQNENEFIGRSEEWGFSGSFNIMDKLYFGMSMNIAHIKRMGNSKYEEDRDQETASYFNYWSINKETHSNAIGVNAKIGLIYHANNWLRLGAAFHSPTIYGFDESQQTISESKFTNIGFNSYTSQESHYEYNFFSPLRWIGSAAFVIGQSGLISLDAEYVNFGAARFIASDYDYSDVNADIKETYGRTFNFRLGSEWRLSNSFVRCGAGYYGSPFGLGQNNGSVKKASVGLTLPASSGIIFDFAYELSYGQQHFKLYDYEPIESVKQNQFRSLFIVTMRYR